jgi:signal transduction histidine kinase
MMSNSVNKNSKPTRQAGMLSQGIFTVPDASLSKLPARLLILIAMTVVFSELMVTLLLSSMPSFPIWLHIGFDAALLVILLSPVMYFGVFRTLMKNLSKRLQAEQALERRGDQLQDEIDRRIHIQKQIEESKATLQAIFDSISDPLILMDADMRVITLNQAGADYYGLSHPRDLGNIACHKEFKDREDPCEGCGVPEAISSGKGKIFERTGFMDERRRERVFIYPVSLKSGENCSVLLRINDITEQRILEKQLVQSEKMSSLGTMVSSIAHEINNPNNFISFNIPILRDYVNEIMPIIDVYAERHPDFEMCRMPYSLFREDISTLLDNIESGSRRISRFISNLKEFSRLKDNVEETWIDLKGVVDQALSICQAQLKKNVKTMVISFPDNAPRIWSDAYALEQILINLLANAAEAADKIESQVQLNVNIQDNWTAHIILEVRDNGCGMDHKTQHMIFDPFFTSKAGSGGTGLGLYVCHSLVERLRGRIEVESEPGKGSTFRIVLPDKERRRKPRV